MFQIFKSLMIRRCQLYPVFDQLSTNNKARSTLSIDNQKRIKQREQRKSMVNNVVKLFCNTVTSGFSKPPLDRGLNLLSPKVR